MKPSIDVPLTRAQITMLIRAANYYNADATDNAKVGRIKVRPTLRNAVKRLQSVVQDQQERG